jgi:hypothetical protein
VEDVDEKGDELDDELGGEDGVEEPPVSARSLPEKRSAVIEEEEDEEEGREAKRSKGCESCPSYGNVAYEGFSI